MEENFQPKLRNEDETVIKKEEPDFGKIYEDMRTLSLKKVKVNIENGEYKSASGASIIFEKDGLVNYEEYSRPDPIDETAPEFYKGTHQILSIDDFCRQQHIDRSSPSYYEGKKWTESEIKEIYRKHHECPKIEREPEADVDVSFNQKFLKDGEMPECPDVGELLNLVDENLEPQASLKKVTRSITKKLRKNLLNDDITVVFKGKYLFANKSSLNITRDHVESMLVTLINMMGEVKAYKIVCNILYKHILETCDTLID
jgi:hypothetical protein